MRLIEVKFRHDFKPTADELAALQSARVYGPDFKLDETGELTNTWEGYLMRADLMPVVPHEVTRCVVDFRANLGLDVDIGNRPLQFNQRVNVAVPGLGLLLLNEVRVATDLCTEELNDYLKQGWRIVAVCPQPNQRRPDYVLGRVNKDLD